MHEEKIANVGREHDSAGDSDHTLVWLVWAALTLALAAIVLRFGSTVPFQDDWAVLQREGPFDILMSDSSGHRIPLTALLMHGAWKLGSMQVALLVHVVLLAGAAGAALLGLSRWAGRLVLADVVVPFSLLTLAQMENLLWSVQTFYTGAAGLACVLLVAIYCHREAGWAARPATAALSLVLPLLGAPGVVYALFLVPALFLLAQRSNTQASGRIPKLVLPLYATSFALAILLASLGPSARPGPVSLQTAFEALSMAFGYLGRFRLPVFGIAMGSVLIVAAAYAAWGGKPQPAGAVRLARTLAALSPLGVALAIAISRGGGAGIRYTTLLIPAWMVLYLTCRVAMGGPRARLLQNLMLLVVSSQFLYQTALGLDFARARRGATEALLADMGQARPLTALVSRHAQYWYLGNEESFRDRMQWARNSGIDPYRGIQPDPLIQATFLSLPAVASDGSSTFVLSAPSPALGVRFRYRTTAERPPNLRFSWTDRVGSSLLPAPWTAWPEVVAAKTKQAPWTKTIWIDDVLHAFTIRPTRDHQRFRLLDVELLTRREE